MRFTRLLLAALLLPALTTQADDLLLIQSYHDGYPWDQSYIHGLHSKLGEQHRLLRFALDTKRLPVEEHAARAEAAWQFFLQSKPRLVILADDAAIRLLAKRLNEHGTPTVFLGLNDNPRLLGLQQLPLVTGVLERPLFRRSIVELQRIMGPELRRVLVLFDSDITSAVAIRESFADRRHYQVGAVSADIHQVSQFDDWQARVSQARQQGYDALIIGLYQTLRDEHERVMDGQQVLAWTAQHSPIPPFAFWDFSVGPDKAIGGLVQFGQVQGEAAASLALEILAGAKPSSLTPRAAENGQYLFSRSGLARWQLQLPEELLDKVYWTE